MQQHLLPFMPSPLSLPRALLRQQRCYLWHPLGNRDFLRTLFFTLVAFDTGARALIFAEKD
jgi:hypothetical protein